ncbi:MAG: class I SAM-dependent methyltransferase [Armatimonadaceae bacterium]
MAEDWATLNDESRDIWNRNAGFWDDHMGDEGNRFHRELVAPAAERLLNVQRGETVLELACGAGLFARQMAARGATVVATDFSDVFIERAKQRAAEYADRIEFHVVDATSEAQVRALGTYRFDAAVCNMALMDIATLEPLFTALRHVLKPQGRFVFTLMHPCFNNDSMTRVVEEQNQGGTIEVTHSVKISRYRTGKASKGIGIRGQEVPQYYFHRSLTDLLIPAFQNGFVVDALEEPYFADREEDPRSLRAYNFREIPLVLAVRLRRIATDPA